MKDGRSILQAYVAKNGGIGAAAAILGMPYSTLASILNGQRGVGKEQAVEMQKASDGKLKATVMVWIEPIKAKA